MFHLGFAFVFSVVLVIVISGIFLCRSEIHQNWRQASLRFKVLFRHAEKEAVARRKLDKTRRAYIKERLKQQEHLNREMSGLDKLLDDRSIDKDTHARYRKLLEMGYKQKRQETRVRYGFTEILTLTG